ncbi:MAG: branched-chain amino acid ABC transporter permease [Deltaproteobacteria bacterium]|nr:branched-chain amino acid ABC transporter permease [Deltaproteobacteria bacterium]MBW2640591.1 branched-chain amino acid ABC transporter permease [Deltaproteobacteria bacterium]MBW2679161.1 branched-chain amino acid ABC transporter permease [Deltaproteobacteria bacterium]
MDFSQQIAQYIVTGLTIGAIYAIVAMGFNIIHNATGIVNFAQCEFISLGGMFMYTLVVLLKVKLIISFFISTAGVALIGALIEIGPIRHARSKQIIVLIFLTIGISEVLRGTAQEVWGTDNVGVPAFSGENPIHLLGGGTIVPQHIWIFAITVLVMLMLHYFFKKTLMGKAMRATAVNRRAAALVGISVNRITLFSFAFSGALGAVAGIIIAPISTTSYDTGIMLGLKGFAAAILGGYGNFAGAILGGIILGLLESLGAGLVSSQYKDAIAFFILLLVLFLKPTGIMGYGEAERV